MPHGVSPAEQQLKAIMETAVDAIILMDGQGVIASFNPAAERIFGCPAHNAIGQSIGVLIPPRSRVAPDRHVRNLLRIRSGTGPGIGRHVAGRRHDGSIFPAELILTRMTLGNQRQFIAIIRDDTQRRETEAQLKRASTELEDRVRQRTASLIDVNRRLRAEKAERLRLEAEVRQHRSVLAHMGRISTLGEMLSSLAHLLNQPLCAMLSNAQTAQRLLEKEPDAREKLKPVLADITQQVYDAADTIRHLRSLLRKNQAPRAPVRLSEIIAKLNPIMQVDARDHKALLIVTVEENLPPVHADPVQIQQVILHLVRNGLEAMMRKPLKTRKLLLSVNLEPAGQTIRVSVSDQGEGIDDRAMAGLFEPFFTTKKLGLGMGLPISRSIIESHEGRLWPTRNSGSGATFQFTLPVHSPDGRGGQTSRNS